LAFKQGAAHVGFKGAHLLAYGGLSHGHAGGGSGK
jgi:hypothetical protein